MGTPPRKNGDRAERHGAAAVPTERSTSVATLYETVTGVMNRRRAERNHAALEPKTMELEPGKYARVERERRFLVEHLPLVRPWADRQISDIYIRGTRLRLRRSMGMVAGEHEVEFKLTQKVPVAGSSAGVQGLVTTVYLSDDEYERFAVLPGISIGKRRLSYPPMGVDIFEDNLDGLMIAEAEFDDDPAMCAFSPPPYCSREVTGLAAFSGFNLASINALPKKSARAALLELVPSLAMRTN